MTTTSLPDVPVDEIDLTNIEFWTKPIEYREAAFAALRRDRPFAHFAEPDAIPGLPVGPGYHAVTRHAHITDISRRPDEFGSAAGATSINDMPAEMLEFYGSMINMDDPRHARLRRIVSRSFTPRVLQKLMDDVEQCATRAVDDIAGRGECDFVTEVAAKVPLQIICEMMSVPERDFDFVFGHTNVILSQGDPEYIPEDADIIGTFIQAGAELSELMEDIGRYRVDHPGDDLTSALVNAEVDGEQLTTQELASFFVLLLAAGNETTRTALSHAMVAFSDHPDQKRLWLEDFDGLAPRAVEEIVRWASPVIWMRRTATRDAEVDGHRFEEGDKFLLFYSSSNRDEAVFDDPFRFDITRDPNPHLGFGGPGPHFCVGAHLARREITVTLRELFTRLGDVHTTGEPQRLRSSFINGIKHLPVTFTRGGSVAPPTG